MSGAAIDPGDRSPADIEEDVERTRAHVAGTLDALRDKLAPGQILDEVIDRVADYARGSGGAAFARNLGGALRDNPLPVLLIGAGVGWLMLSGGGSGMAAQERDPPRLPPSRRPFPETGEESSVVSGAVERAGQAAGAVAEAATRAGAYVGETASRVAQAGSSLASSAREGGATASRKAAAMGESASAAKEQVTSAVKEGWSSASGLMEAQPLLLGLLGLAVGAALGAALPRTEMEEELLGEAADAATERVSAFGREAAEQVRTAASEHLQGAADVASEGYAKVKERLDEGSLVGAGEALGETLSATARAAGDAAGGLVEEARDRLGRNGRPGEGEQKP